MPASTPQPPHIPKTPLRVFVRSAEAPAGPFYVETAELAEGPEISEIADEEISALAHLIYNAYLEWKQP